MTFLCTAHSAAAGVLGVMRGLTLRQVVCQGCWCLADSVAGREVWGC